MGKPGWHKNQVACFQVMWLAIELEFAFARKDLNHGFLGGSVFSQFLVLGKPEKHHPGRGRPQQGSADDPIRSELGFCRNRYPAGDSRVNQRAFIHERNLAVTLCDRFDPGQGLAILVEDIP